MIRGVAMVRNVGKFAEDLDFAFRVREAGYRATYIPEAVVYHDYQRKSAAGSDGDSYLAARVRHWMILLNRHATLPQRIGFLVGGAVVGFIMVVTRQVLSGNVAALKGVPKGVGEYARELPRTGSTRTISARAGFETD